MGDELQFISTVSSALFLSLCEGVGVFREEVFIGWFEKGLFVKEELTVGPNSVKKSIKANKKVIYWQEISAIEVEDYQFPLGLLLHDPFLCPVRLYYAALSCFQ